jgi:uracil-DNA glycosylase
VRRTVLPEALDSDLFVIGQALGRDTQRLSGLPYVFPGGPPYRLSKGGALLDRWLSDVGYTIDPGKPTRRYAYHADLHPGFPGRKDGGGDVVPSAAQMRAGAKWLRREIELIEPRAVICFGKEPALEVLARHGGVQKRRLSEVTGRRWQLRVGRLALVAFAAYHPSGAFQFPTQSEAAWRFVATELRELLGN